MGVIDSPEQYVEGVMRLKVLKEEQKQNTELWQLEKDLEEYEDKFWGRDVQGKE